MKPGDSLAHFTVQEQIGAGGMGAVFRATDTRLGRDVALKVLPPAFAQDSDRLSRFQREAQVLASLQHANIAAIFGIERVGEQTFLVMELCEGEDLSDVMDRGPLGISDARDIAGQIAQGLEEAHDKGIIHRDLKPANIKVSTEGKVKILDFGLARTFQDDPEGKEISGETMTVAASVTRAGVVLGTAAYMSPEQARGKTLDKRTDIWAFGVILYEMLAGLRLYAGETVSDILAAVLRKEPDFAALPDGLPLEITYLIRRCLAQDKNNRLRDIGEARCLVSDDASASSLSMMVQPFADSASPTRGGRSWLWPAIATTALVALVLSLVLGRGGGTDKNALTPRSFTQLTAQGHIEHHGGMGPDGNYFVYSAVGGEDLDIFLQRAGGLNPINLTEDSDAADMHPAVSPDGQRIAFTSNREGGGVYVMGATGESARLVARGGSYPAWAPDGSQLAYSTENFRVPSSRQETSELWIVSTGGTDSRRVPIEIDAIQPSWSPDGQRIAFWSVLSESGQRDLWTVRPDGTDLQRVLDDPYLDYCPVWSRDGQWLYFLSNRGGIDNLWRIRVDPDSGMTQDEPELFTVPSPHVAHFSLSPDGSRLVFTAVRNYSHLHQVALDPVAMTVTGSPRPILKGTMNLGTINISRDGQWMAFMSRGLKEDIYLLKTDGTGLRKLTDDLPRDRGPFFYEDDNRLVFYSDRGGKYDLWSIRPDGAELSQLTDLPSSVWFPKPHPVLDFVIAMNETGTTRLEWNQDRSKLSSPQHWPPDPSDGVKFFGMRWSSDGRFLLGFSAPTINDLESSISIFDMESESYSHPVQVSRGWPRMAWAPDQSGILYIDKSQLHFHDLRHGTTRIILDEETLPGMAQIAVDQPGNALVLMTRQFETDLWMVELGDGLESE